MTNATFILTLAGFSFPVVIVAVAAAAIIFLMFSFLSGRRDTGCSYLFLVVV